MSFFPLLYVPLVCLLCLAGIVMLVFRKYKFGIVFLLCAILFNIFTQSIPLRFTRFDTYGDLKVMTWNILSGSDYMHGHRENPKELVDFVLAQNADVVTFQEYYGNRINKGLYDLMIQHYPYYVCQDHESQVCVFSRYPLGDMEQMVVDTASAGGKRFWESLPDDGLREYNCHRFVLGVPVVLPQGTVQLIACHLASNNYGRKDGYAYGASVRQIETEWIADKVRNTNVPVIVCGDMNDVAGSRTLRSLCSGGLLENAWWEKGLGLGLSYKGYGVWLMRLDHILHTDDIKLNGVRVLRQNFSDHNPLVASFNLQNRN